MLKKLKILWLEERLNEASNYILKNEKRIEKCRKRIAESEAEVDNLIWRLKQERYAND